MGYDLYFWKESGSSPRTPIEVLNAYLDGKCVDGLLQIPKFAIFSDLMQALPGITINLTNHPQFPEQLLWESGDEFMDITIDDYLICVAGHGVEGETFNKIIDIAHKYGMPLYDPQTDKRYVDSEKKAQPSDESGRGAGKERAQSQQESAGPDGPRDKDKQRPAD